MARSVGEAVAFLEVLASCNALDRFEALSLDHDLGAYASQGGDGPKLLDWMGEHEVWPTHLLRVHTANPSGREVMVRQVEAAVARFPEQFTDAFHLEVAFDEQVLKP